MSASEVIAEQDGIAAIPEATSADQARRWAIIISSLVLIAVSIGLYWATAATTIALAILGLGLPALWLVWVRPELGLLTIVFLTSSFIARNTIDIRLPVGGLDTSDIALMGTLGIVVLRSLARQRLTLHLKPVGASLLVFIAFAVFSALYALTYANVEPNWVLGELRPIAYYMVFYLVGLAITKRVQLGVLVVGLFLLADLTAVVVIIQQSIGGSSYLLGAMGEGEWLMWSVGSGALGSAATRIVPPGHVLVYVMSIVAFCQMVFAGHRRVLRAAFALQFIFLTVALLFTYTRAQWIASAIALIIASALLPRSDKGQLARYLLVTALVIALAWGLLGAQLQSQLSNDPAAESLSARLLTIFDPGATFESNSLQWRVFETGEAFRSITQHPIVGVGLGNVYRSVTTLQGEARSGNSRFTRYVHDSYLYIAVKMGLPALLALAAFILAFLIMGLRAYFDSCDGTYKRLILAIVAAFAGLLFWSASQSHLMQSESTIVVGLMAGMVATMRALAQPTGSKAGEPPHQEGER